MARGKAPRVAVTGAKELNRALGRMNVDLSDLTATNRAAAKPVLSTAKQLVPRITGHLSSSMKVTASRLQSKVTAGGRSVPYAGPIHFGWPAHNIAPQPFLYEALDQRREEVVAIYELRVSALVRKLDRETPG